MLRRMFTGRVKKRQIGIQFLPYAIRMAEVRSLEEAVVVRKHATIPADAKIIENNQLSHKEWVSFEIEKMVNEWRCKGRDVVLSIPLSIVVIRKLSIPIVPDKAIRDLIEVEIENTLHLPFENPVFDYVKLQEDQLSSTEDKAQEDPEYVHHEKLHLLIVAAPRDIVQGYVDVVRMAGLKPTAVDVEPIALYRALEKEFLSMSDTGVLLLNVYLNGIDVSIFSNGIPEFIRFIPLAVPFYDETQVYESIALTKEAVKHLEMNGEFTGYGNDLFSEVNRIMSFYQFTMHEGQRKIQQIFLAGELGGLPKVGKYLEERLSVPVSVPSNEHFLTLDGTFKDDSYTVTLGLGMKDVSHK